MKTLGLALIAITTAPLWLPLLAVASIKHTRFFCSLCRSMHERRKGRRTPAR
jgi:hypothetical protein